MRMSHRRSQAYSIIGSDCHRHFSAVQIRSPASEADLLYCCLFNIAIKWWRGRNCFTKSVDCSAGCGALLEEGCFLTSVLDSGFINLRTKRLHQQNRGGRRDCVQRCHFCAVSFTHKANSRHTSFRLWAAGPYFLSNPAKNITLGLIHKRQGI